MGKAHPDTLQFPIDLEGSSDGGDILVVEGQLPKQSGDFKSEIQNEEAQINGIIIYISLLQSILES